MTRPPAFAPARPGRFDGGLRLTRPPLDACAHIAPAPLPERLFVALRQHAGQAGELRVRVGERVLLGQALTRARNPDELPVHAPASGHIEALGDIAAPHPGDLREPGVTLRPDGLDERAPDAVVGPAFREREPAHLQAALAALGVAGLGGAGFPTARKIAAAGERTLHTLVVNAAECEPYITCDEALILRDATGVVAGCEVLLHASGARRCLIAVEDDRPRAIGALREALAAADDRLELAVQPARYPAGGELQLLQALLGMEIPAGTRPVAAGVLCVNAATAHAAGRAVLHGEPSTTRMVTVTGHGVARPCNLLARLGTPVADLIATAGGYRDVRRLILGGPMMGVALPHDQVPVTRAVNCIIAAGDADLDTLPGEQPCIRCGECASVCPARLQPQVLFAAARVDDLEAARAADLEQCIECGCCAYVCPSHIPLLAHFRHARSAARESARAGTTAARARERFLAREARLEAQRRARDRQLAERETRLRDAPDAKPRVSEVRAAVARARRRRAERARGQ